MTNVYIRHNPFTVKTEILVDKEPVREGSVLFKYLNTPMNDWVKEFVPAVIEHTNDEELDIVFKGLQYNYDELESEIKLFTNKNREYDIELTADICKGQIARLGMLNNVIDEMQNIYTATGQNEEYTLAIEKDHMKIVVLGGNDMDRYRFVAELLDIAMPDNNTETAYRFVDDDKISDMELYDAGDYTECRVDIPFTDSRYSQTELYVLPNLETCKNSHFRQGKKAIETDEKTIVIFVLDENERKNNVDFLNMISDQYRKRGKQNKKRFIFVSPDPVSDKRMLSSEYAIKNAKVLAFDEILLVKEHIEEYFSNIYLVHQVKQQNIVIENELQRLEQILQKNSTPELNTEKIEAFEKELDAHFKKCKLLFKNNPVGKNEFLIKTINNIVAEFEQEYQKLLEKGQYNKFSGSSFADYIIEYIDQFCYCENNRPFVIEPKVDIAPEVIEFLQKNDFENEANELQYLSNVSLKREKTKGLKVYLDYNYSAKQKLKKIISSIDYHYRYLPDLSYDEDIKILAEGLIPTYLGGKYKVEEKRVSKREKQEVFSNVKKRFDEEIWAVKDILINYYDYCVREEHTIKVDKMGTAFDKIKNTAKENIHINIMERAAENAVSNETKEQIATVQRLLHQVKESVEL